MNFGGFLTRTWPPYVGCWWVLGVLTHQGLLRIVDLGGWNFSRFTLVAGGRVETMKLMMKMIIMKIPTQQYILYITVYHIYIYHIYTYHIYIYVQYNLLYSTSLQMLFAVRSFKRRTGWEPRFFPDESGPLGPPQKRRSQSLEPYPSYKMFYYIYNNISILWLMLVPPTYDRNWELNLLLWNIICGTKGKTETSFPLWLQCSF